MPAAASGTPLAATNEKSAGAICKRRDAVRLAKTEALQRRERQTARRQLLAGVGRSPRCDTWVMWLSVMWQLCGKTAFRRVWQGVGGPALDL